MPIPVKPTVHDGTNLIVNGRPFEAENAKNIADWAQSLSPTLATQYDTDFIEIPGALLGATVRGRVIGKTVEIKWTCPTSTAAGAVVDIYTEASGIPAQWRPPHHTQPATLYGFGAYPMTGGLTVNGRLHARNNHTAAIPSHQGSITFTIA